MIGQHEVPENWLIYSVRILTELYHSFGVISSEKGIGVQTQVFGKKLYVE